MARLRAGDEDAYVQMVNAYCGRMLAVARRLLRNEEEAYDAVQEAFLQAFKSIENFKEDARLYTWLHRITVNAALMRLRKRKRRNERSIEELLPKFMDDGHRADAGPEWTESAQDAASREEMRELVRNQIDELPETYRTVLLLRDIEEMSTEETATYLDVSVNAVKTRLHRARLALRELLSPHMVGGVV